MAVQLRFRTDTRNNQFQTEANVDQLANEMGSMKLRNARLDFKNVFFPGKPNDPFEDHREHLMDNPGYMGAKAFVYLGPPLDEVCMDLSVTHYRQLPLAYLKQFSKIVDLRLSGSMMEQVPEEVFDCPIGVLDLKHCRVKLVEAFCLGILNRSYPEGAKRGRSSPCLFRASLCSLDVSHVSLNEELIVGMHASFVHLDHLFMKSCGLGQFPINLKMRFLHLSVLDLSNNSIRKIPDEVFQYGSHNMFHVDIEREDSEDTLDLLTTDVGIGEGHIEEVSPSVFCGVEKEGQGQVLHIDMRRNPLSRKMYGIFDRVPRVRISDRHQVVCFPGNLYIYTDLPKPTSCMVKA